MSNYKLKAKHKVTGTIHDFTALDHVHSYSYISEEYNMTFTSKEFNDLYDIVEDPDHPYVNMEVEDINTCDCLEHTCQKSCTTKHTCHAYWCQYCYADRGLPKPITQDDYDIKDRFKKEFGYDYGKYTSIVEPNDVFDKIDSIMTKHNIEYPTTIEDRFHTEFTDSYTGLLNIGKYDHDRLLTWIKNEIK